MALVSCPDCGAQVSDTAVVCAQCGFPLRRDALAAGGGRGASGGNTAGIVIGVAAAGLVMVVVLGILAALAIPRFTAASGRAKEIGGERMLKQAFALENAYYANHGVYAPTLDELRSVGWTEADTSRHYTLEITLGPVGANLVCLDARPKRGADVQPLSMDSVGIIYHDERCAGETLGESRTSAYLPGMDDVPGEGGEAGARTLLREVWLGVVEYRAAHGRDPTELGQVLRHVHFTRASTENTVAVGRSRGRVCVSAVGKDGYAGHSLSVDGDGRLYRGESCLGAVLEQFASTPPADSTSS
jgi:type IV pilus assembly protein PilE